MSFAEIKPEQKMYSVTFKGFDLVRQCEVIGSGWCMAWNLEDASQQAMEEKYWQEGDIFWELGTSEHVSRIVPTGVSM